MKMNQLLSLLLLSSLAANMYAMEEKTIQEIMRERYEKQRAQEAQTEKEAQEKAIQNNDAQTEQESTVPAANPSTQLRTGNNNNNNNVVENPVIEQPVIEEEPIITKDKEENEEPTAEELEQDRLRAEQSRQGTLQQTNTSIQDFCNVQLRKYREGILAREYKDILLDSTLKTQINDRLEKLNANLEYVQTRYANDPEFEPIIEVLNSRIALLTIQEQLANEPLNIELWQELNVCYQQLIALSGNNQLFKQTLEAEQAAAQEAQIMILEGHQPSGQGIIEDFTQIDQANTDALAARMMEQEELEQATQNDAAFAAQITEDQQNQNTLDYATLDAEIRQLFPVQDQQEQNNQDLETAPILQEEPALINQNEGIRPLVMPAPAPNDPDDNSNNDDDNNGFGNNGRQPNRIPTPRQPQNNAPQANQNQDNTTPARSLNTIDIPSFWNNQSPLMKTVIAAIGTSVIGYLVYEFYNWITKKDTRPKNKKINTNKKRRIPARTTRSKFAHRRRR